MIGRVVQHYKILEKLGEGGMGVVYKAEDTALERTVALKLLSSSVAKNAENRTRLFIEARAAAKLNHPSIAGVYAIEENDDEVFIVMEFVDGKELSTVINEAPPPGLSLDEAVRYALDIARGLDAAHRKGVIHRDIKSSNVMISSEGQVKIMDFGLAKIAQSRHVTRIGTTVGTIAYMSPEQSRGEPVDGRTDIWSLGVVLYEMTTGRCPFTGAYESALLYSLTQEDPVPPRTIRPEISPRLESVILKALQKSPDRRFASAEEMIGELQHASGEAPDHASEHAGGGDHLRSIAVLPFVNMSSDPENDYLSDGLAEELITAMTKLEGLHVAARTSAFRFRGREVDVREIGKQLNVATVLEGSVRKSGKRLRITAQLIEAESGYHLWSERFDSQLDDVFLIQDQISLAIVDTLKVTLLGEVKADLTKRQTENPEAYNLYLQGRFHLQKRTPEAIQHAVGIFQESIAKDPSYALAYAGLAEGFLLLERYGVVAPHFAMEQASAAASKAVEMDDTLAEAHHSLGHVKMICNWDWAGAEEAFRKSITLEPNSGAFHHRYGWFLAAMGRLEEAMQEMEKARELDPRSLIINTNLGTVHYFARDFTKAVQQLDKTRELDPDFIVLHQWMGRTYEQIGRFDKAIEELTFAVARLDDAESHASLGHALALSGKRNEALNTLARLDELSKNHVVSGYWRALVYLGLGDHANALMWLHRARAERFDWMMFINVEPLMDPIRTNPQFQSLLRTMELEQR